MLVKYYGLFHQMAEGRDGNLLFYFAYFHHLAPYNWFSAPLTFWRVLIQQLIIIPNSSLCGPYARFWCQSSIIDRLNCHNDGHWHVKAGTKWSPACGWHDKMCFRDRNLLYFVKQFIEFSFKGPLPINHYFHRAWFGVKHLANYYQ